MLERLGRAGLVALHATSRDAEEIGEILLTESGLLARSLDPSTDDLGLEHVEEKKCPQIAGICRRKNSARILTSHNFRVSCAKKCYVSTFTTRSARCVNART